MADEFKFGLDDLQFEDSSDVAMDNDVYQDQTDPAPPVKGIYRLKALTLDARRDKDKNPIVIEGKFPIFTLGLVEIAEGLGEGITRKVGLFYDVTTKPAGPKSFRPGSSGLGDLCRSYGTPNYSSLGEAIAHVREAFDAQSLFTGTLDWAAYDKDFVAAALAQLQLSKDKNERTEDQNKLYNAVYKAARVVGMQHFPYNPERNVFSHILSRGNVQFTNPVNNAPVTIEVEERTLEGRPTLTRFYSNADYSTGKVKIGPIKTKPAVQKQAIG